MSYRVAPEFPMKQPIRCTCERFVDESGVDIRWSLCAWHEGKAQWAAKNTPDCSQAVAAWLASSEAEKALARAYTTVVFGKQSAVTGAERMTAADILEEIRRSNSEAG